MPHPSTSPDPASRLLVGTQGISLDEELIAVRGVVVEGQVVIRHDNSNQKKKRLRQRQRVN